MMMDTTQECRHSVMVDVKDHANIDERVNEGIGDPVKSSVNSATCSEGSSFLQLSEEQLTTGNEGDDGDNNNNEIRVQEVEDDSDNMSEQLTDASATDNASLGSTNTSSVGTHSASISTDLPTAWFVSMVRFLGLWCLVAGTVSMGMKTKMYALERKEQHLEDEFHELASGLIQTAQERHRAILNAMKTMSITAFSSSHGQSWPFVTLPDFDLWTNRYSIGAKAITLVVFAKDSQRETWSEYSQAQSESWVVTEDASEQIIPHVWKIKLDELSLNISLPEMSVLNKESIVEDHWESVAAVSWQSTTPFFPNAINFNQLTSPALQPAITLMNATKLPVQWSAWEVPAATFILQPIERNDSSVVAYLMAQFTWLSYFKAEMIFNPLSTPGVILIVQETCAGYVVELDLYVGREPRLLEPEQLTKIVQDSAMVLEAPLDPSAVQHGEGCSSPIMLQLYATEKFAGVNGSIDVHMEPPKLAIATGVFVMLLGILCFLGYDLVVRRRQAKLAESAKKSLAIVNSLFPANVRDRLMEKEETRNFPTTKSIYRKRSSTGGSRKKTTPQNGRLQSRITTVFQSMAESIAIGNDSITEDVDSESPRQGRNLLNSSLQRRMASKPIADLFPQVTVLFADIAGFTAWSSVREPSQVFTLLESIFEAFDVIAKKHKVFKVETIGDCYVAASGLPDPCANHAIVMCNFARKAIHRMGSVVQALETYLGPNTSELSMRIGLHSGPIMAGVLRGEKTRFQLFGDTMNTAARIEATGEKERIHLSQQTATHLINAGKGDWVKERETLVSAKGKGELQTYWLTLSEKSSNTGECSKASTPEEIVISPPVSGTLISEPMRSRPEDESAEATKALVIAPRFKGEQFKRLVDFNTQVLEGYLKKMVAMRQEAAVYAPSRSQDAEKIKLVPAGISGSVFNEIQESISLPTEPAKYLQNPDSVILAPLVKIQLRAFVATIASMYRNVPFHCFGHASHVVMSVTKLLSRVVTPETIDYRDMRYKIKAGSSALHEYTYGITSDPLTQFAVVFAALIHDVDHTGVPNTQLMREGDEIAKSYQGKSVAEQHSINLAWGLLMENDFKELRGCIYTTQAELDRFRALLVNSVMATDIADKSLSELRRRRWDKVFGIDDHTFPSSHQESTNRKATIVIEHLIQASDVAHTMQHWHVYLRWNKLLFREAYLAHLAGRSDKDPLDSWYQGELGFFDFYIIPLAKKLKECGVFGVASEEYLNYALTNRSEWERKGHSVVEAYRLEFVTSRVCRVDSKVSPLPKEPVSLQFLEGESDNDSSICIKGNATQKSTITDLK